MKQKKKEKPPRCEEKTPIAALTMDIEAIHDGRKKELLSTNLRNLKALFECD
uniref:Uncharacterized protein n=1 Tax=Nelumbo nucifera TaxID=4432 RepID=A0A822Y6X7_NELNU|nr:TPA_asm: hypothetical protein HUJ06_029251 [Nelumbo nucifera]